MALQAVTMPAPIGGLDVVTPIDQTDPNYALELINIFPGASAPTVRAGYQQFCETITNPIVTLTPYNKADGTLQLVASTSTKIYSLNTAGVATDVTGTTTPTSGEWNTVQYAGRLYLCNGSNTAQSFNGTTCSDLVFSGVTLSSLINVTVYKERLYFVEKATTKVWYGGLQVTGTGGSPALTSFDFGYVFSRGGYLVGIGSFSNSANVAVQDYFWACSSEGEIVFYSGNYAGDPTTWGLVAKYYIGKPLGYRAFVRVNNDVWIITEQGIVPISALFQSDPESALLSVSYRINPIISTAANAIGFSHQWSGFFWPQGRRVYIKVPTSGSAGYFLVYSIDTKAWTMFQLYRDTHAATACLFNKLPYYGDYSGQIWKGETGQSDAMISGSGNPISFEFRSAFSFYNSRGNFKVFKDIRPLLEGQRGLSIGLGMDTDFKRQDSLPVIVTGTSDFTQWSVAGSTLGSSGYVPWGSSWSSSTEYIFDRFATKGQGNCAAIRCAGALQNSTLKFLGFEIRYDLGGQI